MDEEFGTDPADWDAYADQLGLNVPESRYLVDRIAERTTMETVFFAEKLEFIDDLRLRAETETGAHWSDPDSLDWRSLRAEIAAAAQVHERTAQSLLDLARALLHRFPATFHGLRYGGLTQRHARIVVEQAVGLPEELSTEYEARLLPFAEKLVPSRFEKLAAKVRASLSPEAMAERHREALAGRRMAIDPAGDGMAWLGVYGPAEKIIGGAAAVTGIAKTLVGTPGETRTLSQIEADVFLDLITDAAGITAPTVDGEQPAASPAARRGVRAEVFVHVPVLTAMGKSSEPADLEGYGPIDAETARELAGTATGWIRLLTDPETATVLSFGQKVYKVPSALRRYLVVRDEVCRFVGCTRAAKYCDVDHTVPWVEDGETIASNLAHLCRGHHRLKGSGRWKVAHDPGGTGVLTWTSWTGRTYTSEPAVRLRPPRKQGPVVSKLLAQTEWADDSPLPNVASF